MAEVNLVGLSPVALKALAAKALALAADLEKRQPTYELALEAGIEDCGYETVRNGFVAEYRGSAEIVMADGGRWKAIGHGPRGTAEYVSKQGWIEFIPVQGA
jgi:hypothetical protein